MSQVTLKGDPVQIGGSFPKAGDTVKDFNLAKKIYYYYNNTKLLNKKIHFAYKNLNRFDYNKNLEKYYDEVTNLF